MKNSLVDLNNYLFEELERLNDEEELRENESLEKEIKRSKATTSVAQQIINNANTVLSAKKYADEYGLSSKEIPKMLGTSEDEK